MHIEICIYIYTGIGIDCTVVFCLRGLHTSIPWIKMRGEPTSHCQQNLGGQLETRSVMGMTNPPGFAMILPCVVR